MPSRGGETDASPERMSHQHRSGPAEVIEQSDDVGAERFELIVAGRTPGRLTEAAHVDGNNLTVDGDARGRSDPVIGKIRQPVGDQDRRPARPSKPPIENLGVSGPDPAGLMVLRAHRPNSTWMRSSLADDDAHAGDPLRHQVVVPQLRARVAHLAGGGGSRDQVRTSCAPKPTIRSISKSVMRSKSS